MTTLKFQFWMTQNHSQCQQIYQKGNQFFFRNQFDAHFSWQLRWMNFVGLGFLKIVLLDSDFLCFLNCFLQYLFFGKTWLSFKYFEMLNRVFSSLHDTVRLSFLFIHTPVEYKIQHNVKALSRLMREWTPFSPSGLVNQFFHTVFYNG